MDTNLVSEVTKPTPSPGVIRWLDQASPVNTYASVTTLGELRIGVENLAPGKCRSELELWLEQGLPVWFAANLLPVTKDISDRWGRMTVLAKKNGTPLATADGLIAATAFEHNLTLVTRNVSHFAGLPIRTLNPWTA